jgi:peptidoglycan/LPS O-acetylase OafA/YrhL
VPQLTFTRYVAALIVVFFHFGGGVGADPGSWLGVLRQGPAMVAYFFVLSGFILATVYGAPADAAARRKFWIARFARIYPVYLLALVITLVLVAGSGERISRSAALLQATLLQAWVPNRIGMLNYPGWSLSVEAFFYAVFPGLAWLLFRIGTSRVVAIAGALWLVSWVAGEAGERLAPRTGWAFDFWHYNPLLHLNSFVVGVAAGVVMRRHRDALLQSRWIVGGGALALWFGALFVAVLFFAGQVALARVTGLALATDRGLLAPLFAVSIVGLALDRSRIANALAAPPLVMLGEASYSVYILQAPLWALYRPALGPWIESPALSFVVYATLLTFVSVATSYAFERPARAWIRRRMQDPSASRVAGIGLNPVPGKHP